MKYVIDRFEEGIAVCEDSKGNMINVYDYPKGAKEGDCLYKNDGIFYIDEEETKRLKEDAKQFIDDIFG